jgi:hypothetical protein
MTRAKRIAAAAVLAVPLVLAAVYAAVSHRRAATPDATPNATPAFDMVKTLDTLARERGVWDSPWDMPAEKIAWLRDALARERDPQKRFDLRREIAETFLIAGTSELAIAELEELQKELGPVMTPRHAQIVKADLAFAYLRMGELQNCAWNHNAESCLFPVQGGGVHAARLGMGEAVKRYAELLADPKVDPESAFSYRWLLNIGHMTLGEYPDKVPKRWLIPPAAFKSQYDLGLFRDVSASRGVVEFGQAGGVILDDFDGDGHLDLMISHMGIRDPLQFYRNNGDGTFTQATDKAGLKGIVGGLNLVQADYDNDGCLDALLLRGAWLHETGKFPPSLLRNNCDGSFTDVTARAGLLSGYPTQTGAWADVNGDGLLDLVVGYEILRERIKWPASTPNYKLYLNDGKGGFTDTGLESGIRIDGMVKGVVWGDYDNDGLPDLYVSLLGAPNLLFHNLGVRDGVPRFEDVTARAGVAEPHSSFTTWFFDFDNDGWQDIFVSGYKATLPNVVREVLGRKAEAQGERPRLYRNNRDGTFTDVSRSVGIDQLLLTMGANFGDLDNDGWLDFYLGTGVPALQTLVPNRMFRNAAGRAFQDVTTAGGFGHLQKGHAIAFGDVDNDGQQDVFAVMGGAIQSDKFWSALYKNPGHDNHWLQLRLTGVKANRQAVGARIRAVVTENGARREIHRVVSSGGSFGANPLRPHLGLGKARSVDLLEIRWPGSNTVQQFAGPIAADAVYEVREGDGGLRKATPARKVTAAR